jgi:beta-aspartyl-peptidase (threonine type)
MKQLTVILLFLLSILNTQAQTTGNYTIVIHGGAGTILKKNMSSEKEAAYHAKLKEALHIGDSILRNGGICLDAVEQVIHILEDSPLFNAGKGAVFTHEGHNELDASIMNGADLNAGAVAGVRDIRNPISAARKVMEKSAHVMLSGKGASLFAKEQGLDIVNPSYFYTEKRWQSLQKLLNKKRKATQNDKHGTVGCVVLDSYGNLAAGTSTGGMTNKQYGRIGDSPIIGAGTYANNKTCAVSCTGHGEYYIRLAFARDISAQMEYLNQSVQEACETEIDKLTALKGTGGVIAVDKMGNIAMEFNTSGMYRAYLKSNGETYIGIYFDN